jgi:acyl carrier protein
MSPAETHSHRGAVDRDDVARIVCEQLAEILDVDPDNVVLDSRLREDLDVDDYALLDLVEAVEAELGERSIGLRIDDDDLAELVTVADAVECVCARLEDHNESGGSE